MLPAYLLAEGSTFDFAPSNAYMGSSRELMGHLHPIWSRLRDANSRGAAIWLRIR
ncbi:MAG: hypothetical protein IPM29_05970 [Planctomycetes bacterium]|nr:hypothetical protein [Planctomycetota bacterium]